MRTRGFEKISEEQWLADTGGGVAMSIDDVAEPRRATKKSAGYDFFSTKEFSLYPQEDILIPTGIKAYMPDDEFLDIRPRSGHGFKYYVRLANTTGIIDSDYYNNSQNEGHIWVKIRNESNNSRKVLNIKAGDAICQGIFLEYRLADGDSVDNGTERNGGIGSTQ